MAVTDKPTNEDIGAAFIAWYAEALRLFPDGLVTQAQAAQMLGLGRMAVNRLVGRGYLRAVYFPRQPEIAGYGATESDPTWSRLTQWFGQWVGKMKFPKTCYVSFGDVLELWRMGDARKKCKLDWSWLIPAFRSSREDVREHQPEAILQERIERAEFWANNYSLLKSHPTHGIVASTKIYLHTDLLEWFAETAGEVGLTRNQLIFWALEQWQQQQQGTREALATLPTERDASAVRAKVWEEVRKNPDALQAIWTIVYDEFGGELGQHGATGLLMNGDVA